ncbi:MAG: hypothetical protein F4057_11605 [Acidobacteria bacterium]|nr:hypothetical protein [Acidobacteriota bacterium]
MPAIRRVFVLALLAALAAAPAAAEVIRLDITSRQTLDVDVPGGVGPYERLRGRVVYALDPDLEANARIVDLAAAAPNEEGRVEFYADIEILAPVDRSRARPTLLYEVNNRGRWLWGADPFLLSRGYVAVASGWIAEVPVSRDLLRLEAPVANDDNGVNVVGAVRAEFVTDAPAERLRVSNQLSYEPVAASVPEATLTRRLRERDAPEPIARDRWRLLVTELPREEGSGLVELQVELDGGFEPGFIYEVIYEARGSVVQGAGFAAIRDLVSLLRHDTSALNPLRGADGQPLARRVIGAGLSQSGRALRMFLHEGFNADEQGRQVFDGVMPVIAGGGQGFFNHRFASPTRTNSQHTGHLYPADVFPFTYGEETDPFTGRSDCLLRRARASGTLPKVMHLDSASEYWHRSGSLVVTDPAGERDSEIPPEVRVYVFGGTQHGPAARPHDRGQLPPSPTPFRPFQQALFLAMDRWITDGTPPPPSVHPRIADGTLVEWQEEPSGWIPLPNVRYPTVIQQPELLDYGKDFAKHRRIERQPPLRTGKQYGVRVPALDADNNERGALQMPSVAVPLATFTGWNLRNPASGAPDALVRLTGGRIPFPRTAADRERTGDPRRAVTERYASFEDYLEQYMTAAEKLLAAGYLVDEHMDGLEAHAQSARPLFGGGKQ